MPLVLVHWGFQQPPRTGLSCRPHLSGGLLRSEASPEVLDMAESGASYCVETGFH